MFISNSTVHDEIKIPWFLAGVLFLLMAAILSPPVLGYIAAADGRMDSGRAYAWAVVVLLLFLSSLSFAIAMRISCMLHLLLFVYRRKVRFFITCSSLAALATLCYVYWANKVDLLGRISPQYPIAQEIQQILRKNGRSAAVLYLVDYMQTRVVSRSMRPVQTWDRTTSEIQTASDLILDGSLGTVLGHPEFDWQQGDVIDWRHTEPAILWELQRHTFLFDVITPGGARHQEGLKYAEQFVSEWFRGNRYKLNFNPWAWNDDAASNRIQMQMELMEILRKYNMSMPDLEIAFLKSLVQHGEWLADEANYNLRTNHGLMQDCALLDIALRYPEFDRGQRWRKICIERFEKRIRHSVTANGVFLELTPYYHFLVTRKALWFLCTCEKNDISLSPDVLTKLKKMVLFCREILQPDKSLPLISDTRQKTVGLANWPWDSLPKWPELTELQKVIAKNDEPPNQQGIKFYPESGYFILRTCNHEWSCQSALMFTLMAGPLSTAHHHPNKLSITLFAHGKPIITGPGYPGWWDLDKRNNLIATTSQSTVSVDLRSQRKGACSMRFLKTVPEVYPLNSVQCFVAMQAESLLYEGVRHIRSIFYGPSYGSILIIDELKSAEQHTYRQHFRIAEGLAISQHPYCVEVVDRALGSSAILNIQSQMLSQGDTTFPEIEMDGQVVTFVARGASLHFITLMSTVCESITEPVYCDGVLSWTGPSGTLTVDLPVSSPDECSWSSQKKAVEGDDLNATVRVGERPLTLKAICNDCLPIEIDE
jgi:hypothetical protein